MSSYWSSLPRYYCKYCNYWCVDNKINRQRHESSEQHQQNVEKYLARQKSAKERVAAQEKEVNRVLKQAEDDALSSMLNNNEIKDSRTLDALGGRKKTQKRKAFLFDDMPPIRIHYDTVPSVQEWRAQFEENQPVVYDEATGNIPPPPPMPTSEPIVYDEKMGNIPPPPPLTSTSHPTPYNAPPAPSQAAPTEQTEQTEQKPPIKYNFDYDSKLTEEDLFGSWKTVSVTQVSEADLQKREEQYEKAVMKSNKEEKKKGKGKKKAAEKPKKDEEEDEDEKDAFDMYNPFGGSYKGVNLSLDEPMYVPEKKALKPKVEEVKVEEKKEEKVDQPFISTPISFSFSPKPSSASQKPAAPVSKSLSAFFSYTVCSVRRAKCVFFPWFLGLESACRRSKNGRHNWCRILDGISHPLISISFS